MYKIPANTLFIGKQLVFVPECHSTNSLALQMSQSGTIAEGMVVITDNQFAGRGQRGNTWESAAGMNLTFSVILTPAFLKPTDQYYLTMVTSLALCDFLTTKTGYPVAIKWPNDILVHEKKISGILIENQLQGNRILVAVAGIGFNVNQEYFQNTRAGSLRTVTDKTYELEATLHEILGFLEVRYLQLKQQKFNTLKDEYLSKLYRLGEPHRYSTPEGTFEGIIRGVDDTGKLCVEVDGSLKYFGIKEITFA